MHNLLSPQCFTFPSVSLCVQWTTSGILYWFISIVLGWFLLSSCLWCISCARHYDVSHAKQQCHIQMKILVIKAVPRFWVYRFHLSIYFMLSWEYGLRSEMFLVVLAMNLFNKNLDLLGRHAYLLYSSAERAKEVLEKYSEKKLEINGRRLILLKWRQTIPKIVPDGRTFLLPVVPSLPLHIIIVF